MLNHSSCGGVRVAGLNVVRTVFAPSLHAHRAETRLTVYRAHAHFIVQRRDKSWRICVADFPKIISQNLRYLAAPWSEFNENRTRWS